MPLHTQVIRDGLVVALERGWGWFHVECMLLAARLDSGEGPEGEDSTPGTILGLELAAKVEADRSVPCLMTSELAREFVSFNGNPLGSRGVYRLKQAWTFEDEADGEIFSLLAGDELHMYR